MADNHVDWPRVHDLPGTTCTFRAAPEDFFVDEILGFELTGSGPHLWVQVEKTGLNTRDVVEALASVVGCRAMEIGHAGLKDKNAVTRQWFSLPLPGSLQTTALLGGQALVLQQQRNSRKLRPGIHRGNRFRIRLREIGYDGDKLVAAASRLAASGVPNYFGPQRFGLDGGNVAMARALFAGELAKTTRFRRGLYLSAARAYLFNAVLARRVTDGSWDRLLPGDVMALAGSHSVFAAQADDPDLDRRLQSGDIHPTGPLWGKGLLMTTAVVASLESEVVSSYQDLAAGIEAAGMKQERRPLRVLPEGLQVEPVDGQQLVLEFTLPAGAYATSVVRELVTATGL